MLTKQLTKERLWPQKTGGGVPRASDTKPLNEKVPKRGQHINPPAYRGIGLKTCPPVNPKTELERKNKKKDDQKNENKKSRLGIERESCRANGLCSTILG